MTGPSLRPFVRDPREPVVHDLDPLQFGGQPVLVRLTVRRSDDGAWRGRLAFIDGDTGRAWETAEIFCGGSEQELWQSVRGLGRHHFRDLCRSLR